MSLRFAADRNGRDILKCLITAQHTNAAGEKFANVEILDHKDVSAGVIRERPLLLLKEQHLFSSLAICKYLLGSCPKPTSPPLLPPQGSPLRWSVEEWCNWCCDALHTALDGNKPEATKQCLDKLEAALTQDHIADKSFTLADVFVFSALLRSRLGTAAALATHTKVAAWFERVAAHNSVSTTLKHYSTTLFANAPPSGNDKGGEKGGVRGGEDKSTAGASGKERAGKLALLAARNNASAAGLNGSQPGLTKPHYSGRTKFSITTAINYTNGNPHIGHAYEAVTSDVIARFHRIFGRQVFFMTGTDEHGQKIATTAEKMGKTPIEICDHYAAGFQALNKRMGISNDFFVRTTMAKHKAACQKLWTIAKEAGDIYLGTYEGWYNVREETFVTENEAKANDYKDPGSGLPLTKMQESSYFFRQSKYQQRLIQHIKDHPKFIQPEFRRQEILQRLQEPLLDLSVSRTTFSWGIPVPGDEKHVMYVWFDALSNYLSGMDWPNGPNSHHWPAGVHIIGKDIIWFHTVIWPCMLFSCNIPLPETVFAHGFVNAADGRKMSKSYGNVVDPNDVLDKYSTDTFRYYLVKAAKYGDDPSYSEDGLIDCHNADLCDALGNLVHRATNLCHKFCDGKVPDTSKTMLEHSPPFDIEALGMEVDRLLEEFCIQEAIDLTVEACKETNKYLTDRAPWAQKDEAARAVAIRHVLEALYVLAHFFEPIIPNASAHIFEKFNTPRKSIPTLSRFFDNLKPGTPIEVGAILFDKLKVRQAEVPLQKVETRVGVVKAVKQHPAAERCYVLTVQVSDTDTRNIVAAIKDAYTEKDLIDRKVCVVCNMKQVNIKGEVSLGMLMAVEGPGGKSVLLEAGQSAAVGSLLEAKGYPAVLRGRENITKKDFDALEFSVTADGKVHYAAKKEGGADKKAAAVAPAEVLPLEVGQGTGVVCAPGVAAGKLKFK